MNVSASIELTRGELALVQLSLSGRNCLLLSVVIFPFLFPLSQTSNLLYLKMQNIISQLNIVSHLVLTV